MSNSYDFDLFVLGGGSAGVRVARWSAGLGAKVGICEEDRYGGTCVIRGCIPKKFMVLGSHLPEEIEAMKGYGWSVGNVTHDWEAFRVAREKEISRLSSLYEKILDKNNAKRFSGKGVVVDPHEVEVDGKRYSSKYIVVAVGGWPVLPEFPGIEHAVSSNGMFELKERPKRFLVNGGGYIAVEFAGILKSFGSEVSVVIRRDRVLRGFDESLRSFLQTEMEKKGIAFEKNANIKAIEQSGSALQVQLDNGSKKEVDAVLLATGRRPKTAGLGLEEVGVELNKNGAVQVDNFHQTSVDSIYALGDCTDRMNLTPVATTEGTLLAENLFAGKSVEMNYENIPSAVFSQPPLSSVGLTEEAAKEKYGKLDVYESEFRALKLTLTDLQERTFMKLICDQKSQRVVGAHMCGADAAEIMQAVGIAIKAGAKKADFDATVGIHPTSAEEFTTLRTKRD